MPVKTLLFRIVGSFRPPSIWDDAVPVRGELFGADRLEQHARSLALAQTVSAHPSRVPSLHRRLDANGRSLLRSYQASAAELESGRRIAPAAEWLLDNYPLVEKQIREARTALPASYYRQLPKLATGSFAGYPRIFGLAWAFVAHTDSLLDITMLRRFITAYQQVQPLTIAELWAVAITLRIVLLENLRRLADQIAMGRIARADADVLAGRLSAAESAHYALDLDIALRSPEPVSELFAAQLAKRLRGHDPQTTPALGWLEERLAQQATTIDDVVMHAQQRLGASNVSVRNVITSLRLMADIDWPDLFESVSLVDARLREGSAFAAMDFPTRDRYRSSIEQLARRSSCSELEVAEQALAAGRAAGDACMQTPGSDARERARVEDPGYHLISEGRIAFERAIDFHPSLLLRAGRWQGGFGIRAYLASIVATTAVLLGLSWALLPGDAPGLLNALWLLALLLPATEVASAAVNRLVIWRTGAVTLPGLELVTGVPSSLRTLVAVPTLLTGKDDILEQIGRLEVHHLASGGGDIVLALLTDGLDANTQELSSDAPLLAIAIEKIAALNRRYGPAAEGPRFILLHRRRHFNASEGVWMGRERKRGKLHELNRLLRGAVDTDFVALDGVLPVAPAGVRYVITLDADTRMPRDAALRLVGKMAHPLNQPRFDEARQRVVGGHGLLQPRITPGLPMDGEGSLYQWASSGAAGLDPYAMAVSDVYQDLFGEGSYTGKGIYDVDVFEAAMRDRVPDNSLLSHDLFEGVFARAGLVTDVELIEQAPARYDVDARRQHRWTRGDWQLLPWLRGSGKGLGAVPAVGRWKMLDNLRRSLVAPSTLLALGAAWMLPPESAVVAVALVLAGVVLPATLPLFTAVWPHRADVRLLDHFRGLMADVQLSTVQALLKLAFLADQAWRMCDAIGRTLMRLLVTRRHLLEWTSTAQSSRGARPGLALYYRQMAPGTAAGLVLTASVLWLAPAAPVLLIWPFVLLWLAAPALALWTSSPRPLPRQRLRQQDVLLMRITARRTWRFFETCVTPADHMLPPDNFQEDPKPALARRTSPTNIGLYLLSAVAARDFGWTGTLDTIERLEATFRTMRNMSRFNGHFFNWYGTEDLRVLDPPYVSSVDSGNLAGHLIALANACELWRDSPLASADKTGLADSLQLARRAAAALPGTQEATVSPLSMLLDEMGGHLEGPGTLEAIAPVLGRLAEKAAHEARSAWPTGLEDVADLIYWIDAVGRSAASHARDHGQHESRPELTARLQTLADSARAMARGMDFAFLMNPERRLLSIGYSVNDQQLDSGCYDLLASEARLASLFAIAKGDAPTRHWFRLGRGVTPVGAGAALLSWSGSMFEYLMPSLVMRAPAASLLERTNRLVVARQMAYGDSLGIPWGISESAYNARDLEFTYQYANFGVPGLGLKRGLADDRVVAPYATSLAAMVDARAACLNYEHLCALGGLGRYGFYEALDFTPSRLPVGSKVAVVRSYMAHHQGMTIVALSNVLLAGVMRARLHREPMIQASELLLQERMPREITIAPPRVEDARASREDLFGPETAVRHVPTAPPGPVPTTHLLSNGRYSVMLTAAGGGYSRWRGLSITRWREDSTRDPWGAFVYLRDVRSGQCWSATAQPSGGRGQPGVAHFGEDRASFAYRDGTLATTLEILVSGEDDCEVRRLSLANRGWRARELEVTSYTELALAEPSADEAHPAFSKLFVVTEYLPEFGALLASRRPRAPDDPPIWAAHFAVVDGKITAAPQYETDRARFVGRGRDATTACAIEEEAPLSNTVGYVLDPAFSLRQRVLVPPGASVSVAFWTVVASSRAELLDLIDRHHDRSAFERAATLAWTQAQVQLRHLGIDSEEAADFQRLAAPLIYVDQRMRAHPEVIRRGAGAQSRLWSHAVSGDLPILLLRIDDLEDIEQVSQLLRAHEYWRMKQLAVDLVILNERASSYVQDLQVAIETAVRSSQSRPRIDAGPAQGTIHTLRSDLIGSEIRDSLRSAARVELVARQGPIAERLSRLSIRMTGSASGLALAAPPPMPHERLAPPTQPPSSDDLEFFNGFGGFAMDGREYVIRLSAGQMTPAPWINVIANPGFGFQVSAEGSASTWCENSRENRLTPWSNDPISDPSGEAFYVKDLDGDLLCSPTALPVRGSGEYETRHGWGHSRFTHATNGILLTLLQYVPPEDPVKISRLTLRNLSDRPRRLSVTTYAEWVLGTSRGASAPFITTAIDAASGALLARNRWGIAFEGRVAFADLGGRQTSWTCDRSEFLGRHGTLAAPAALSGQQSLSGTTGAGLDPCAALQCVVELAAGESIEIVALLGEGGSDEDARALIARYRVADLDAVLADVAAYWARTLGAVQVRTPDRAMDILLNGWLLYQTISCRLMARSAFYQSSGAYGFRDQLQDGMALATAWPEETRRHLLRAAGRQFPEGDFQHWWLPQTGQGVRTRISDDSVWLAYAAAAYVRRSGDDGILEERVEFIDGPALRAGQHDAFYAPDEASEAPATLYEHCARGLDRAVSLTGPNGLPLIGGGDWNDGMNRVGAGGSGESVWLGWFLIHVIDLVSSWAEHRQDPRAGLWRTHAESIREAIERVAWDGEWYRRATFDDGTWLGSAQSRECQIDSIAQSWSVLSGAADPARSRQAMESLLRHLVREDTGLALLLAPPFDCTEQDPGYIKGYPPGLRENGGQYSHAAMWAILALTRLGDGDRAWALFDKVNPIQHARTPADANRYKVEPYVVAADVYSAPAHVGRGGWTWYTGSAGWMYQAGVEGILGIRREADRIRIAPCIPSAWPGFHVELNVESTSVSVAVRRTRLADSAVATAVLDGTLVEIPPDGVTVDLDGQAHDLVIHLPVPKTSEHPVELKDAQ